MSQLESCILLQTGLVVSIGHDVINGAGLKIKQNSMAQACLSCLFCEITNSLPLRAKKKNMTVWTRWHAGIALALLPHSMIFLGSSPMPEAFLGGVWMFSLTTFPPSGFQC